MLKGSCTILLKVATWQFAKGKQQNDKKTIKLFLYTPLRYTGEVEVQFHTFLSSQIDESECQPRTTASLFQTTAASTNWIGVSVGPRADLDHLEETETFYHCRYSNSRPSTIRLWATSCVSLDYLPYKHKETGFFYAGHAAVSLSLPASDGQFNVNTTTQLRILDEWTQTGEVQHSRVCSDENRPPKCAVLKRILNRSFCYIRKSQILIASYICVKHGLWYRTFWLRISVALFNKNLTT